MSKNKQEIAVSKPDSSSMGSVSVPFERQGSVQQGFDKKGRPFRKILDDKGLYTKEEVLKDGTPKLTIKDLSQKKK